MISPSRFVLSDKKDNTSGFANKGGITNVLFLITLLVICQKPRKVIFWEVIKSLVLLA